MEAKKEPLLLNQLSLRPNQLDQSLPFQLAITAPDPGAYQLLVRAEAVDGEATLLNNEQTCFLNVRDSGARVLYLEGQPRQEQKFLRIALSDSPDLQIESRWFPESTRPEWPIDIEPAARGCLRLHYSWRLGCRCLGNRLAETNRGTSSRRSRIDHLGWLSRLRSRRLSQIAAANVLPVEMDDTRQAFGKPIDPRCALDRRYSFQPLWFTSHHRPAVGKRCQSTSID